MSECPRTQLSQISYFLHSFLQKSTFKLGIISGRNGALGTHLSSSFINYWSHRVKNNSVISHSGFRNSVNKSLDFYFPRNCILTILTAFNAEEFQKNLCRYPYFIYYFWNTNKWLQKCIEAGKRKMLNKC